MKKLLLASVLTFSATAMIADDIHSDYDTRVDFLNARGEIVRSQLFRNTSGDFILFDIKEYYNNDNPALGAVNSYWDNIYGIRFIREGEECYPLYITSAEGVTGNFYITDEKGNETKHGFGTTVTTRSGNLVNLDIRVPKGSFPQISYRGELTFKNNDEYMGYEYWATADPTPDHGYGNPWTLFYSNPVRSLSPETREEINDILTQDYWPGFIFRDKNDPELWHCSFPMDNEPATYKIRYVVRDSKMLHNMVNAALDGLYTQWQGQNQMNTGDDFFGHIFGDYLSGDAISSLRMLTPVLDDANLERSRGLIPAYAWSQAFAYITQANVILKAMEYYDNVPKADLDWARAQMLGLRSYGYLRLLQCTAPRWADSDNGNAYCAPLETEFSLENKPLATMNDIIAQCYADLDMVAALLPVRYGNHPTEITATVARGLKLRIAQLKEDWTTVEQLSAQILAEKPLTTNEELKSGFFSEQPSWIWSASNYACDADGNGNNKLWYYSMHANRACNGAYPGVWCMGCDAIDRDLYLSMPATDVRRSLFVMPESVSKLSLYNTVSNWYRSKYVDNNTMFAGIMGDWAKSSPVFSNYFDKTLSATPEGVTHPAFSCTEYGNPVPVIFGSHVKFYQPGEIMDEAKIVLMRADEIQLSRAEALLRLGRNAEAVEALSELNRMRDAEYAFAGASSDEIMEEIIRIRKVELWGEGHSWFDMKRWNRPIVRHKYESGNEMSGNWQAEKFGIYEVPTDAYNGWRAVIYDPILEWNPTIDINLLNYNTYVLPESTNVNSKKTPEVKSAISNGNNVKFGHNGSYKPLQTPVEFNPSVDIE